MIDAIKLIRPGDGDPRADFTYCVVKPKATGDKRSARRRRTRLRSGKLLDPRNALLIDCQIYDRSEKGARIRLIGECPVPRSIRLYEESPERLLELRRIFGDGVNQAADLVSGATSIPSRNLTPLMTFGNWL